MPAFKFITEHLVNEVDASQEYDSDAQPVALTSLKGYGDAGMVAARFVEAIDSEPQEYYLTISFINDFGNFFASSMVEYQLVEYQVSDSITLLGHAEFEKQFPERKDMQGAGPLKRRVLGLPARNLGSAYFQVKIDGFIPHWGTTAPIERAVSLFKSFLGIGIALAGC